MHVLWTILVYKSFFFQVNKHVSKTSALHCAVDANKLNVLKVILKFKPDLEIQVMQQICIVLHKYQKIFQIIGRRWRHTTSPCGILVSLLNSIFINSYRKFHRYDEEIAECLLNAGAIINAKNNRGITPLMIAVRKGNQKATKAFLKWLSIDLQQQVNKGLQ